MALRERRREWQLGPFVAASERPKSPGNSLFKELNRPQAENDFDAMVEQLCAPYYAETVGLPSVPPAVLFLMLFGGYVEGLKSHRAISWRRSHSRSHGAFLRLSPADPLPNPSCVSKTSERLPKEAFAEVFRVILRAAAREGMP